jgi:hypothetical protein
VVLDAEGITKSNLLSSIPFFLLVQFLHQNDACLGAFSPHLSLSLCNAQTYSDVCFQKSSCTATAYGSVAISLLGIPFHAL